MNTDELFKAVYGLPKDYLNLLVHSLMMGGKISFHEIMEAHVEYMDNLMKGKSEAYFRLQDKVMFMWRDKKANWSDDLADIMHHLLNEGRINTTHEEIDKRFKTKKRIKEE